MDEVENERVKGHTSPLAWLLKEIPIQMRIRIRIEDEFECEFKQLVCSCVQTQSKCYILQDVLNVLVYVVVYVVVVVVVVV